MSPLQNDAWSGYNLHLSPLGLNPQFQAHLVCCLLGIWVEKAEFEFVVWEIQPRYSSEKQRARLIKRVICFNLSPSDGVFSHNLLPVYLCLLHCVSHSGFQLLLLCLPPPNRRLQPPVQWHVSNRMFTWLLWCVHQDHLQTVTFYLSFNIQVVLSSNSSSVFELPWFDPNGLCNFPPGEGTDCLHLCKLLRNYEKQD